MSSEVLAFFIGLFGSLHCVAMCGPLVMALPLSGNTWWFSLIQKLIYQLGRILTYSAFGFLAGFIGKGFNILGLQQTLGLITGLTLVAIAFVHFSGKKYSRLIAFQIWIVSPIATMMGRWLSKSYGALFAGLLHGLLPCGMIYMAIAASLNSGSPLAGGRFMFFFGLGTIPLLLTASLMSGFIRKLKISVFLTPFLFLIAGLFLVSRSINLAIPYVSETVRIENQSAECK